MPIYEYQCTNCHHHFDLIQKINDEPVIQCEQCNKNTLVKLVSAAGFQLKGTGWYATDFKNNNTSSTESSGPKDEVKKKTDSGTSSANDSD